MKTSVASSGRKAAQYFYFPPQQKGNKSAGDQQLYDIYM